jgi:hypothetical protein
MVAGGRVVVLPAGVADAAGLSEPAVFTKVTEGGVNTGS